MKNIRPLQIAVLRILATTIVSEWSVQGFGMLRLYIRKIGRLHIWDRALRYPGVSMVHNHSWDLRSTIVCGHLMNRRWNEDRIGERWKKQRIVTGYNCEFVAPIEDVCLVEEPREVFIAGGVYRQAAKQIHLTDAADGTITMMERNEDENGEADLYWRETEAWGTARPRPATPEEVMNTVAKAQRMLEVAIG